MKIDFEIIVFVKSLPILAILPQIPFEKKTRHNRINELINGVAHATIKK